MADKNDGGDKTEKPTPKRLKDARKKGNVPKSKDVTNTVVLILWIAMFALGLGFAADRFAALFDTALIAPGTEGDFTHRLLTVGEAALDVFLILSASVLIPVALFGTLVEFLQTGPVLSFEKLKPKMENLNPASGLKRMFSMDNLVELFKYVINTSILFLIAWLVFKAFSADIALLPQATPGAMSNGLWEVLLRVLLWTVGIFTLVAILDAAYQKYSYTKKLRMSRRDIKQELKDSEGDPMIKQKRREAHQEWSQQSAMQAARDANVLIVNPTHVAIALDYDRELSPVPIVSAKGEDHVARAMREAAEEEAVPILRNVDLARELLANAEEGDLIPQDLFDIIAEVILWAQEVQATVEKQKQGEEESAAQGRFTPPGEDLTNYPAESP
ncbi:type III secretion system export apparatus subunit SctU [Thiolapillus sp.]